MRRLDTILDMVEIDATSPPPGPVLTKILATVGPASAQPAVIARLIQEGTRAFRINFSHGTFEQFDAMRVAIREASMNADVPVAILGDLSGPKIRVAAQPEGGIELTPGDRVVFQRHELSLDQRGEHQPSGGGASGGAIVSSRDGHKEVLFATTHEGLVDDVAPGQRVFIDDGNVRMIAVELSGEGDDRKLICRVTVGGLVTSKKGVNLPDSQVSQPSVTDWDWQCVDWAVEHAIDCLALSFVRRADDVLTLRKRLKTLLDHQGRRMPIIAKIEKPQALADLDAIIQASDMLMVARGDLGVEMDIAQVPVIQKRIIQQSHDYGKPVIVATQMLQSMIDSPLPTRAEASDVANAIFDGADAVMLSGETAVGKYPVHTVATMARIARVAEEAIELDPGLARQPPKKLQESRYRTAALAHGVSIAKRDLGAKVVAIWSQLGGGARYLSQNRMRVPILAASSNPEALRQMSLLFGVHPVMMDTPRSVEEFAHLMDAWLLSHGWLERGDPYLLVAGEPIGTPGVTNSMRIAYAGDVCHA